MQSLKKRVQQSVISWSKTSDAVILLKGVHLKNTRVKVTGLFSVLQIKGWRNFTFEGLTCQKKQTASRWEVYSQEPDPAGSLWSENPWGGGLWGWGAKISNTLKQKWCFSANMKTRHWKEKEQRRSKPKNDGQDFYN